jgi:general secretion pathway protein G
MEVRQMKASGGFTLLELILVMVIIGILAGMVTISVAGRGTQARETRVKADLSVYQRAVEAYALEHNDKYPKSLNDLVGREKEYVIKLENDPWGNPYVFAYPGKKNKYDLYSRGIDGQSGTPDDISVWDTNDQPIAN